MSNVIEVLAERFADNKHRHDGVSWDLIEKKLETNIKLLETIVRMEESGGEPDVIKIGKELFFVDCSTESPKKRRSLCYDDESHKSRKEFKPTGSAIGMANKIGIELLDEAQYRLLQTLDVFDLKTSSWIKTPKKIRDLGGAIFADRRYDHVFVYHNGAESYYAARGFRGCVRI